MMHWDTGPTPTPKIPDMGPTSFPMLLTSGGLHLRPVHLKTYPLPLPKLVPTASGGHRNTYGWQTGGTHPTGMPSCSSIFYNLQPRNPCNLSDRIDIRVRVGDLDLLCLEPV